MPILEWLNKNEAVKIADKVPYRLLKANPELSYGEQTDNMIIKDRHFDYLEFFEFIFFDKFHLFGWYLK